MRTKSPYLLLLLGLAVAIAVAAPALAGGSTTVLGNRVWVDLDCDGLQDPEEPGLFAIGVNLACFGADGIPASSDDLVAFDVTSPDGSYAFDEVTPVGGGAAQPIPPNAPCAIYITLNQTQPLTLSPTLNDVLGNSFDELDSDGVTGIPGLPAETVGVIVITGRPGEDELTVDFGFSALASCSCDCDCDADGDGVCSPGNDILTVIDCANGMCGDCADPAVAGQLNGCDLDCDGDVDQLDVDAVVCAAAGGGVSCCVLTCGGDDDCADLDGDGLRDNSCRKVTCEGDGCDSSDIVFGDVGGFDGSCIPDGTADANDRFHVLNCFTNSNTQGTADGYPCEANPPLALNVDVGGPFGACCPDGVCDGNDVFHVLNVFQGINPCSCSNGHPDFECPCDNPTEPPENPVYCPPGGGGGALAAEVSEEVRLRLASRSRVAPGGSLRVQAFFIDPLQDLRGYQLHLGVEGGDRGSLELIDIRIEERADHALAGTGYWSAFNADGHQALVGLDSGGVPTAAEAYLATFTYRASSNAEGTFTIRALHDAADPAHRTFVFPTPAGSTISLRSSTVATVEIRELSGGVDPTGATLGEGGDRPIDFGAATNDGGD